MPIFEIQCIQSEDPVEIHFGGGPETRGHPEFRGFSCEGEAACKQAGVLCALFDAQGLRPFEPRDAFEFFNS
jgi:hypothetical protein